MIWTPAALTDVEVIRRHIAAETGPLTADAVGDRLRAATDVLGESAEIGRVSGRGGRVLTTVPPYFIRYRVQTQRVLVIGVRHGARRPLA